MNREWKGKFRLKFVIIGRLGLALMEQSANNFRKIVMHRSASMSLLAGSCRQFQPHLGEIRRFLFYPQGGINLAVKFFEEGSGSRPYLITSNLRFVVKIAGEYRAYGMKMLI
jgi:DNA-directed RNA polymerase sigma subunit (sigma70/sigma32)